MQAATKEKLLGGAGTALIVGALGYALILGFDVRIGRRVQDVVALLDLRAPPPPPPRVEKVVVRLAAKAAGKASPRNLRNKATEVVAPKPVLRPPPPPIVVAPKAGTGAAASNGASNRPGPGQGAGGTGDGTGSGGTGDGEGGGGTPPQHIKGRLSFSDMPQDLRQTGFTASVGVRYRVGLDGRVSDCRVTASSGRAELDDETCRLIEQRFRFRPARDENDQPVGSIIVENHEWVNEITQDDGYR